MSIDTPQTPLVAPASHPEGPSLPRRLASVLVGVGMLSAAACLDEPPAEEVGVTVGGQATAADNFSARIAARMELTDELTEGYSIEASRKALAQQEKDSNPRVQALQSDIIDLKVFQQVLPYTEEVAAEDLSHIKNPAILQEVKDFFVTKEIDVITKMAEFSPETALADFAKLPADVQAKNQRLMQWTLAGSVAKFASFDMPRAQATLSLITDPEAQQQVLQIIELENKVDAWVDSSFEDVSVDDYYAMRQDITTLDENLRLTIDEIKRETAGSVSDATDIDLRIYDLRKEIQRLTTEEIKASNNFEVQAYTASELPPLPNRSAAIDLREVDTEKTIVHGEGEQYAEFAQVTVVDGKVVLHFDADASVPKKAQKQIRDAFENARPIVEPAFQSGELSVLRFVLSDDYNPFYNPGLRAIFMVLPNDASTSVDQLASGIVHESIHALTRNVTSMEDTTDAEGAVISQACTALKDASFNALEGHYQALPDSITRLLAIAKPEHAPIIETILAAVKDGSFEQLIKGPLAEYSTDDKFGMFLNNCYDFTPVSLIVEATKLSGVTATDEELDYLYDSEEFLKFYDDWEFTLGYVSVYEKLNEANYVDTDYYGKEYLGHSQDNASEMMATLLNVVLSYEDQVKEMMRERMSEETKLATLTALRATVDIIVARHPSLQGLLSAVEADIVAAANGA